MGKKESKFKKDFFDRVKKAESVLLVPHINPDADSVSSVLAMYSVLKQKYPNKNIQMKCSGLLANTWDHFENFKKLKSIDDISSSLKKFELIVFLDNNSYNMFSFHPEKLGEFKDKFVCIDHHHVARAKGFSLSYIDSFVLSTAEIVYKLFVRGSGKISPSLCETLFLGIERDSGSFRYVDGKRADALIYAGELVKKGKIDVEILRGKYEKKSWKSTALLKELIGNAKLREIKPYPPFISSFLSVETCKSYEYEEVKEAVHSFMDNFFRDVEEATWLLLTYPETRGVSVSMRSKDNKFSVRKLIIKTGLNGGGHDKAAGAKIEGKGIEPEETLGKIVKWLRANT